VERLARLAEHSADLGVEIMAGGGVRLEDVPALAAAGVDAIHLSAKRVVADDGGPGGGAGGYEVTDDAVAHAVAKAVRELQLR
jgi:copper homeostasis protein